MSWINYYYSVPATTVRELYDSYRHDHAVYVDIETFASYVTIDAPLPLPSPSNHNHSVPATTVRELYDSYRHDHVDPMDFETFANNVTAIL
jgi:hypothetical protein